MNKINNETATSGGLNETRCGAPLKIFGALRRRKPFSLSTDQIGLQVTGYRLQRLFRINFGGVRFAVGVDQVEGLAGVGSSRGAVRRLPSSSIR